MTPDPTKLSDAPSPTRIASRLAESIDRRGRSSPKRTQWQERAAVLAWFRPSTIDGPPTGELRLADEEWGTFLSDTEAMADRGGGARILRAVVRREVLSRMGPVAWKAVRAEIKKPPEEPLQRMLDAALGSGGIALDQLDRPDLDALLVVSYWVEGVVSGFPPRDEIAARIAQKDLLGPLTRLTTRFVGREGELDDLRTYVEEIAAGSLMKRISGFVGNRWSDLIGRKSLMIYGAGGVGKSTLVAKFLSECADNKLPFIYIDLDRASIDPRNPFVILDEAQRQLAVQVPRIRPLAEKFGAELVQLLRDRASSEASRSSHQLSGSVQQFCQLVEQALPDERRLPLVIDTFEEAQALGDQAVLGIARLVRSLVEVLPRIRPIIVGRVPPERDILDSTPVPLLGFELPQAAEFLGQILSRHHKIEVGTDTLTSVAKVVSGTPLALSLAAQIIADQGADAVPRPGFLGRLLHLSDNAGLYARILKHLKDPQLQALAKPGLLVRRLTPSVVSEVLAEPCGLGVLRPAEAEELLDRLQKAVSLVERDPDGALRHRPDVRRQMLPQLERDVGADMARRIDEAAVAYYAKASPSDAVSLAERLYHLLRLGDISAVNALWADKSATQGSVDRLRGAVDELRPNARRALKLRLEIPLTSDERRAAGQDEWEKATERAVAAALADGDFASAAKYLSERSERLEDSRLPLLEVEVYSGQAQWQRVTEIALPAAERAIHQGGARDAFALYLAASRAFEAQGQVAEALRCLDSAEVQARRSGDAEALLRLAATRSRIDEARGAEPMQMRQIQERVVQDLRSSGALERLGGAALREVAAALGQFDPSLIRAALYRLGLPQTTSTAMADLALILSQQSEGDSDRAKRVREVFASLLAGTARELQFHLAQIGFDPGGVDGVRGPKTIAALRQYQQARGLPADGEATVSILEKIRTEAVQLPIDTKLWESTLANTSGLALGSALGELIGPEPTTTGLSGWALNALKARVQRDVFSGSASLS